MKPGAVLYRTCKGSVSFVWKNDDGTCMYRVNFTNGQYLHTNSLDIAKAEIKGQLVQLNLFQGMESQKEGKS